jgi:predicted neutral ceramidase superfamily lipid hydrolase
VQIPQNDKELTEAFAKIGLPPKFSEAKLFFMALAFLLLLFTNSDVWREVSWLLDEDSVKVKFTVIMMIFYTALGTIAAFYYAVSSKEKSKHTKELLLAFAMIVTLLSGISVGWYAFNHSQGILIILPIINIIYTILTYFSMGHQSHIILDRNTRFLELLVGSTIIVAIFYISQYAYHNYWSITFSTCLAYSVLVHDAINRLFAGKESEL